jgi:nucleotide-binding universal stress UspA family protein
MIVVGVDGSEPSLEALRWAIDEARVRHSTVRAVYGWFMHWDAPYGFAPPETFDRERLQREAGEALDEWVTQVTGQSPDIEIERDAVEGQAAHVLVGVAEGAELLVVGSRGHGGFSGLLLGSVSQQCAHHAPCPVVIIRKPRPVVEGRPEIA